MQRAEIQQLLKQKPFQPFRVVLSDGRDFDIRYPEMNLLARTYIKIGIPEPNGSNPICDHLVFVPLTQVIRIELLPSIAAS